MNRKRTGLLVVVLAVAVVVVLIAARPGVPPAPTSLPADPDSPAPVPAMTEAERDDRVRIAHEAWESHVPLVKGAALELPEDAVVDALVSRRSTEIEAPPTVTLSPLLLPVYIIVRNAEVAFVSTETGQFQIGADHKTTFQFLVDQLGRESMQLVPTEFYEERWGPHREDYR